MIDKMERVNRELVYKGTILDIYKDTMKFVLKLVGISYQITIQKLTVIDMQMRPSGLS